MLVSSHYRIGGIVYRFIISKYIPFPPFDKILFKAGNILPDISNKLSRLDHTIEGSLIPYNNFIERAQNTALSSGERIISLGATCHYLTDYFCKYHVKEPFKNYSILRHLLYELQLHLILLTMLPFINKYITQIFTEETFLKGAQNLDIFYSDENKTIMDLQLLFASLQNDYHSKKSTIKTDITFALKATLFYTALIIYKYPIKNPVRLTFDYITPSYIRKETL